MNVSGDSTWLTIDESDVSGLNQITFMPTSAGQTVTFQAGEPSLSQYPFKLLIARQMSSFSYN